MAGTTGLEPAASAVTAERFYNNLQDRGDCQGPPKLFNIPQDTAFCGLGCGLENITFQPEDVSLHFHLQGCILSGLPIIRPVNQALSYTD